jgi:hypothetical protein
MDDVVEFPRARTKPLSEEEALERLRQAGRIEGIGAFAKLVDWERTGASRVVGQWERDGKVVRTPRPGYPTVIEAVVASVPAVHTAIAPPVLHTPAHPAQPAIWWRRVVRRRAQPVAQPAHPVPHPAWRFLVAAVLFLAAIDLAGSGLVMNARYAASLGSGEGATIQAAIGIAIDAIALVLLSAGYLLWSNGHGRFAVLAWIVWPVMLGLSLMNTIGFSATNISDALAKRSAAVTKTLNEAKKASNAASDLQDWRDERKAITEKRSLDEIKAQLVIDRKKVDRIDRDAFEATVGCRRLTPDTTKACDPVLPMLKALAAAQRRDKLDQDIRAAENKQDGAPTAEGNQESPTTITTSADPQSEMVPKLVVRVTRGWIDPTPDDIAIVRILGFTVPPLLAGLFLMFATALLAPPRTT